MILRLRDQPFGQPRRGVGAANSSAQGIVDLAPFMRLQARRKPKATKQQHSFSQAHTHGLTAPNEKAVFTDRLCNLGCRLQIGLEPTYAANMHNA
ncbi:uncharacterized protein TrAFT101_000913 [Trichoderma asperellum]|uniref:uncharacterized protein n=1 Tax=Trichoderma asperellum TaxID=101201 RepID=UPI0033294E87|nr:hypothetical protein TrAFT101_000913 [Trichoderma asperellum]